jgi:hypothetical protein
MKKRAGECPASAGSSALPAKGDAAFAAASPQVAPERVVSYVLDREQLPDALPEKDLKPVFVRGITPGRAPG